MPIDYQPLPLFRYYCQKIIPLVFDDSMSYYEQLCKVVEYLNETITNVNKLGAQVQINAGDIAQLKQEIAIVQTELEKIANGGYISQYINQLANWIDNNLQELVGRVVKYIFFGLTDDGYFVAYIPDTWDFINFDTIIDTTSPLYGHLLLQW